jgi:serine/threonine protein phosphatase PrpC
VPASKLQGKSAKDLAAMLRSGPAKPGKAKPAGKKPPRKKPPRKKPVARELTEEQWAEVERKTQATMAALMSDPEIAAIFAEADRMDLSVEASGGGYSEQGPRDYQEDRWFARGNLAITADGMGGHESGGEAAQITVDTIASFLPRSPDPNLLLDAVHEANKRVHQVLRGRGGCTLVTGLVSGNDLYVAHVGDARCTAVYKGRLERITKDHSIVQQMVDAGRISEEEARTHPHRNIVTRSIGSERTVQVDTKRVPLKAGMTFVFSSDGVHDYLTNPEFIRICEGSHDPKSVARRLVQKALANGSNDNCTATVLKIHPATSMYEEVGGYGMEMNPSEAEREALAHRLVEKADALLAMESPEEMDGAAAAPEQVEEVRPAVRQAAVRPVEKRSACLAWLPVEGVHTDPRLGRVQVCVCSPADALDAEGVVPPAGRGAKPRDSSEVGGLLGAPSTGERASEREEEGRRSDAACSGDSP